MTAPKPRCSKQAGTLVRWCSDRECRLEGIDQGSSECAACGKATVRLTHMVVCTDKRGVFMGLGEERLTKKLESTVHLYDVRMCVHFSKTIGGVMGLASKGPDGQCRISAAVPEATFPDVHAIFRCSAKSVECWEEEPWSTR